MDPLFDLTAHPATLDTRHPFVGLDASGLEAVSFTPVQYERVRGVIVAFNGHIASLLLADGRLVPVSSLKLSDPDEALARLRALNK